jgi:hypothetical protein
VPFSFSSILGKEYLPLVISFLKRWLGFGVREQPEKLVGPIKSVSLKGVRVEKDDNLEWLDPPCTIADVAAWDKYWHDQISHGLTPLLFDLANNGGELAAVMAKLGMQSVLFAGNGISQEPRAFAEAGFHTTALDPCAVALSFAEAWQFGPKDYEFNMGRQPRREGGQAQFFVGDILDSGKCPGPFDAVVERRMLQLFEPERRPAALAALASRMKENAILLSHTHYGNWSPEQGRTHPLQSLYLDAGWQQWNPYEKPKPPGRVAWLYFSTG